MLIIPLKMPKIQSVYSFNLHASEIHVSEICGANFISSEGSFAKNCMELMLTCKHSAGFVMKSITSESINSGQRNISPLNANAYGWLLHIRSLFFQIQPIVLKQYNCSLLFVPLFYLENQIQRFLYVVLKA